MERAVQAVSHLPCTGLTVSLMSTNSVVIKAGIFTEWFQPHLIPSVPCNLSEHRD